MSTAVVIFWRHFTTLLQTKYLLHLPCNEHSLISYEDGFNNLFALDGCPDIYNHLKYVRIRVTDKF